MIQTKRPAIVSARNVVRQTGFSVSAVEVKIVACIADLKRHTTQLCTVITFTKVHQKECACITTRLKTIQMSTDKRAVRHISGAEYQQGVKEEV